MVQVIKHGNKKNSKSLNSWQSITSKYLKEIHQRRKSEYQGEGECSVSKRRTTGGKMGSGVGVGLGNDSVTGRGGPQEGK